MTIASRVSQAARGGSLAQVVGHLSMPTKSPWVWTVRGVEPGTVLSPKRRVRDLQADFVKPSSLKHELPKRGRPEVAFAGRSNAGKSTLIGKLIGNARLVRTSKEAGCTKTVNFFSLRDGHTSPEQSFLVDLPGYGFARESRQVVRQWTKTVRDYLQGRPSTALRRTFVLVDSRHGIQEGDEEMLSILDQAGVSNQVVLTKVDKVTQAELLKAVESVCQSALYRPATHPVVHCVSAHKGMGMEELMDTVWHLTEF